MLIVNALFFWQIIGLLVGKSKITDKMNDTKKKQKQELFSNQIQKQFDKIDALSGKFAKKLAELQKDQDSFNTYMKNQNLFHG